MTSYVPPLFKTGDLELRFKNDEVSIYGTARGLTRLAELCLQLAANRDHEDHIHLEDYEILTSESLRGAVAMFHDVKRNDGQE